MNSVIIIIIALLVLILYLYGVYAKVIMSANSVREAISGIDIQLKKRYDLIPNILTIAKKFMEHEKSIFEKITELRTKAMNSMPGSAQKFAAEAQLDSQLKSLMVNVENYPALKSDATMVQAMETYNEVEEHIAASRRFYNSALTQLRNAIQIFPGSLFAACAGETASYSYYETDTASKSSIKASDYL